MKQIILLFSVILIFCQTPNLFAAASLQNDDLLEPELVHPRVEKVITYLLSRSHYQKKAIDDSLSSDFYNNYIESLDGNRIYFTQADIDSFESFRYNLDDSLRFGSLKPAYQIFNLFLKRFRQRMEFALKRLDTKFDFSIDETFQMDRRKLDWPTSQSELNNIWRKRLKNGALKLKLAGKKWDDISKTLKKRYSNMLKRLNKTNSEDVFQIYMNAFADTFDPHTNYMSPKLSDDFKIRMSHSLEGIGATLRTEDEYTQVVQIVPGGPADKSGLLHPNDRISGVGQGDNGEIVDVIGWRIDDVVELIRGPKTTKVRLQIYPAEASLESAPDTIKITRDKVRLADRAAKSDTLELKENGHKFKVGIIDIPDFYLDYDGMRKGDPNYASTTRDVKRLISELKSAGVESIVIDLRNNGGGFLTEAVKLTGLFIKEGPVVQVRQTNGRLEIDRDTDDRVYYDGPLAVLINRFSASASEIFAAAIQDYGRGIIVGNQSYGKGTVQNIIRLNRFFPRTSEKLGQVKMTIAKFYRVNGGSTQNMGVVPDIAFPAQYGKNEIGERNMKNALLWDEIDPLHFKAVQMVPRNTIERLQSRHLARIHQNLRFKYLMENFDLMQKEREKKVISLNEGKRRLQRKKVEDRKEAHKKELEKLNLADNKDDLYLMESASILDDYIQLMK